MMTDHAFDMHDMGGGRSMMLPRGELPSTMWHKGMNSLPENAMLGIQDTMVEEMMGGPKKKMKMSHTDVNANFAVFRPPDDMRLRGEIIAPRSAQGLVTIKAVFEPGSDKFVLPAHSLVFATERQHGGAVLVDNLNQDAPLRPIIGVSLEDPLDATKVLEEHVSRRTVAIAIDGVVALHCPPEFAREFCFGDPVYVSSVPLGFETDFQGVKMLIPSYRKQAKGYNCRIGTFVEQIDARTGGIRLKLGIGNWEVSDAIAVASALKPDAPASARSGRRQVNKLMRRLSSTKTRFAKGVLSLLSIAIYFYGIEGRKLPTKETFFKFAKYIFDSVDVPQSVTDQFMSLKESAANIGSVLSNILTVPEGQTLVTAEFVEALKDRITSIVNGDFGLSEFINFDPTRFDTVPDAEITSRLLDLTGTTRAEGEAMPDLLTRASESAEITASPSWTGFANLAYANDVLSGRLTINRVPEDVREQVQEIVNNPDNYGIAISSNTSSTVPGGSFLPTVPAGLLAVVNNSALT